LLNAILIALRLTPTYRDLPLVHDIIEHSEDLTRFTIYFQTPSSIIHNIYGSSTIGEQREDINRFDLFVDSHEDLVKLFEVGLHFLPICQEIFCFLNVFDAVVVYFVSAILNPPSWWRDEAPIGFLPNRYTCIYKCVRQNLMPTQIIIADVFILTAIFNLESPSPITDRK